MHHEGLQLRLHRFCLLRVARHRGGNVFQVDVSGNNIGDMRPVHRR